MTELSTQPIDYYRSFERTHYGERASTMTRWESFVPPGVESEQWRQMFGADVNNLEHGRLQYGMTRAYIRQSRAHGVIISDAAQRRLEIAAVIHDQHETLDGHGDYRTGTKPSGHKEKELREGKAAMLDDSFYPDLSDEARQEAASVVDSVLDEANGDPVLTRQFKASEFLNHLRTGFIAMGILDSTLVEEEYPHKRYLQAMVADCMTNVIPVLRRLAKNDPVVRSVLVSQRTTITRCFNLEEGWETHFGDDSGEMLLKYTMQGDFFSESLHNGADDPSSSE